MMRGWGGLKLYQLIEGGVVIIADHLRLPLVELLRVRSQMRDHVGVGVGPVCLLLLKREKGPEGMARHLITHHEVFIRENTFTMFAFLLLTARHNAKIRVKETHNVL